jgi:hypothetical protein
VDIDERVMCVFVVEEDEAEKMVRRSFYNCSFILVQPIDLIRRIEYEIMLFNNNIN